MFDIFPFTNSGMNDALLWSEILTHLFSILPIPWIVVERISPSLRSLPWVAPTPAGVPVNIKSPGYELAKNTDGYYKVGKTTDPLLHKTSADYVKTKSIFEFIEDMYYKPNSFKLAFD